MGPARQADPVAFLARLREAHPGMRLVFTRGGCFELYQVMRAIWPDAEPWYDFEKAHVYTRIGPFFYGIWKAWGFSGLSMVYTGILFGTFALAFLTAWRASAAPSMSRLPNCRAAR